MQFHIYDGQWKEVRIEINPQLIKAKDSTNDSFTCVMKANTESKAIKPMTPFRITYDDLTKQIFWIINDSVSVYSYNPKTYKHSLSIIQYRYFLNHHLLRNTVFNQPRIDKQKLYYATSVQYIKQSGSTHMDYVPFSRTIALNNMQDWADVTVINGHSKVKSANIYTKIYAVKDNTATSTIPKQRELIEITDERVLNQLNAQFNKNAKIILLANNQSIFSFDPFEYLNQEILVEAIATACNTYLSLYPHVELTLKYEVDGATMSDPEDMAFVHPIDNTIEYSEDGLARYVTVQVYLDLELYNYNMYDVIDTMLKQNTLTTSSGRKREPLFYLPTEEQNPTLYHLLKNTYCPDSLAFTQATWYEAMTEIFKFFDAGFLFDENKVLDIEPYNTLQNDISDKRLTAKTLQYSNKNYNNGKVAYYQNAIKEIELEKLKTRSVSLGVPEKTDYAIVVPKPIYDVEELRIYIKNDVGLFDQPSGSVTNNTKVNIELDLSKFVVNQEIWTILNKNEYSSITADWKEMTQNASLFFERGSTNINVSTYYKTTFDREYPVLNNVFSKASRRFFGMSTTIPGSPNTNLTVGLTQTWEDQMFYIKYICQTEGRMQVETINNKYKGEELTNQNDGLVDLSKLGLNILGEAIKNGEPMLTASLEFNDWDERPREGDYFVDEDGNRWVANVINVSVVAVGVYKSTIEFVKDFNAISLRIRSDDVKRLTEISGEQAVLSEENYIDYIYVSDVNHGPTRSSIVLGIPALSSMIGQTFGLEKSAFDVKDVWGAAITSLYANNEVIRINDETGDSENIYIPMIKYGAGNCVCFEMQFDNPINAGNVLLANQTGWWGQLTSYFSQATPYTDSEGWADKFTIKFLDKGENYNNVVMTQYPKLALEATIPGTTIVVHNFNVIGTIDKLQYYKKPNEIFALNYEWCFLPLPTERNDFFIGSAFINDNAFVKKGLKKRFKLFYGTESYTVLDRIGKGTSVDAIITLNESESSNLAILYISLLTPSAITVDHWALCDELGNIYFSGNHTHTLSNTSEPFIYFSTKNTRMLDDDELVQIAIPGFDTSVTLKVYPSEWFVIPPTWTINVFGHPTSYIDPEMGTAVLHGTTNPSQVLMGATLSFLDISKEDERNNVSFDSTTGSFTYNIYKNHYTSGDLSATITYARTGQTTSVSCPFRIQVPYLKGRALSSFSITPASIVIGGTLIVPNQINYNAVTGEFSGTVFQETQPDETVEYQIDFVIE